MVQEKEMVVNGYKFEDAEEYEKALEEKESIERIMKKINLNNKELVLSLYSTLIIQEKLSTVIGMNYLCRLRDIIVKKKYASETELLPIPVGQFRPGSADSFRLSEAKRTIEHMKNDAVKGRERTKTLFIFNIVLIVVIAVMMYIASTSNNINIINYENKIIDKYSQWEKQLNEREKYIKEVEKQLGIDN